MGEVHWFHPSDNSTGFSTTDYWASWSTGFQHIHLSRMSAVAFITMTASMLVLPIAKPNNKDMRGRVTVMLAVMALCMIWHSAQEVSFYSYNPPSSLAPPLLGNGNWAPQSIFYEIIGDFVAVLWAFLTGIWMQTPCTFKIGSGGANTPRPATAGDSNTPLLEATSSPLPRTVQRGPVDPAAAAAAAAEMADWGEKSFWRHGGSALMGCVVYPGFAILMGPVLMIMGVAALPSIRKVSGTFRTDILLWSLLFLIPVGLFWRSMYKTFWKSGVPPFRTDKDPASDEARREKVRKAKEYRTRVFATAICHVLSVVVGFLFCMMQWMGGKEFAQPIFAFVVSGAISFIVSLILQAVLAAKRRKPHSR